MIFWEVDMFVVNHILEEAHRSMTIFRMENKGVEWCAWSDMDVATSWHG